MQTRLFFLAQKKRRNRKITSRSARSYRIPSNKCEYSYVLFCFCLQLKAFYVDLLVPLETNLEKDTKVVQVCDYNNLLYYTGNNLYFDTIYQRKLEHLYIYCRCEYIIIKTMDIMNNKEWECWCILNFLLFTTGFDKMLSSGIKQKIQQQNKKKITIIIKTKKITIKKTSI